MKLKAGHDLPFFSKVTMSYLEIYNENIRDLLNPSSGHLELRDDSKGKNITVAGLSEVTTKNTDEVKKSFERPDPQYTKTLLNKIANTFNVIFAG